MAPYFPFASAGNNPVSAIDHKVSDKPDTGRSTVSRAPSADTGPATQEFKFALEGDVASASEIVGLYRILIRRRISDVGTEAARRGSIE
jgi:hypothetical protein